MSEFTSNEGEGRDRTPGNTTPVAVGYSAAYADALVVGVGTRLTVESRPSEYPGWVWCRDSGGAGAWIPEVFLEITGSVAVITSDYDSTELTVGQGEEVQVLSEVAGWALCRQAGGRRGWLPVENLAGPA
jgi:SH3-like domain-containing protein